MRLREGVPELALAPPQQRAYRDFVATLGEVGQHNERRLQRILYRSAANVSAASPLKSYIAAEVDEGEGRQEALAELKLAYDKLEAQLDERQRGVLWACSWPRAASCRRRAERVEPPPLPRSSAAPSTPPARRCAPGPARRASPRACAWPA